MSARAWAYLLFVFALAIGLMAWAFAIARPPSAEEALLFLLLCVAATLAHLFKVELPPHQTYFVGMIPFFAAVLLLQPHFFALVVVIAHLIEWVKERWVQSKLLRNWYLQPFNMAAHVIPGLAAWALVQAGGVLNFQSAAPESVAVVVLAALSYVLLNHLLIGFALILARKMSFKDSGILDTDNLVMELIQLLLGFVVAALWRFNPWLILPALTPLGLIYRALSVPSLRQQARTDGKTGLWNARHFNELFRGELDRARRFNRPLSFVMADLDLLRNINNTYGHLAGDAALATVGHSIRDLVREFDVAGRYGGEEFAIILPETDVDDACSFAERLRRHIEGLDIAITTSDQPLHLTMSLGVATFPHDAQLAADLVHAADVAVYQAKLQGRNRVVSTSSLPRSLTVDALSTHDQTDTTYRAATLPLSDARGPMPVINARPARPAPPPARPAAPAPARRSSLFAPFVASVIALGVLVLAVGLGRFELPAPEIVLPLALIAVFAQLPAVRSYDDNTVSVSVAFAFAAALLGGIPGAALVSLAIVLSNQAAVMISDYRHSGVALPPGEGRASVYRTAFNWATHLLAGAVPALVGQWPGLGLEIWNVPWHAAPAIASALVYYAIDSGLIAAAIAFSRGASVVRTWREQFQWLAGHYVALCLMGLLLAVAGRDYGLLGILVFSVPVFGMTYAQRQYLERTRSGVQELQRMNDELLNANHVVMEASRRLNAMNEELVQTLAKIIDARDPFGTGHAFQVARYGTAIAQRLQLSPERIEILRQAAFMHDIGKLAMPERLLHKAGPFTPAEYEIIKSHAALGAELLETCVALRHLAPIARYHHERFDGSGYPERLAGEQIPLEARILAVCDAAEAMASDRPYHRALSAGEVVAELRRCAGTQFDPQVVDAFVGLVESEGAAWVVNSALAAQQKQESPDLERLRADYFATLSRAD